ncbi:hypothetical protein CCUS01_03923 [Colletotrichum cuscutae]|uniref:Uncharacterized protein n=1 Tax=Colletotrichum cuscutae TaxID=1209917 RepID=A0AAI9VGX2_9PEZI|nr:hypothetical protein CCUS01_03923 [Colletotrichum cuscutae]
MSPALFESHRRTPSGQDPERRKSGSGFLFLNNRFKSCPGHDIQLHRSSFSLSSAHPPASIASLDPCLYAGP